MSDFDDRYHEVRESSNKKRTLQHESDFLEVEKFINLNVDLLRKPIGELEIIDIGCSNGEFSEKFNSIGSVTGVEINKIQASEAAKRIKLVLREIPKNSIFDIVLIRGTLQHLPDENIFFNFLSENLAGPGAIVAILANPNADSAIYKRTGSLPALDVSPKFESNFKIYSPSSLTPKLTDCGISVKQISYPYFRTPYANPSVDFIAGVFSLLTRKKMKHAFPRSMFNLIGMKNLN